MRQHLHTLFLTLLSLVCSSAAMAIDANTVEVFYNGSSAIVSIASNISQYVTVESGTSSHVRIIQSDDFAGVDATTDNPDGEIFYSLSGTSSDGEFYLGGSYKCTVELNGLTLTNPSGPAVNIQNGKRVSVSAKKGKMNTLADGPNENYNGCFHCKGHTKFKGKGTLNIVGNSRHGIYSKEYVEVKNLELNISGAEKDGIHCKNYFYMESGTLKIESAGDDAIQVELDGDTSTGETTEHEDEDSGNFYHEGGSITVGIYGNKAVKADGSVNLRAGTRNFTIDETEQYADVSELEAAGNEASTSETYDLSGRRAKASRPGIYVVREGKKAKVILR